MSRKNGHRFSAADMRQCKKKRSVSNGIRSGAKARRMCRSPVDSGLAGSWPVLALVGHIPQAAIGRMHGHLHEVRDQAGILQRLVDFHAHIRGPGEAANLVATAIAAMRTGRPGPAALECAIDSWGIEGPVPPASAPAPACGRKSPPVAR